MDDQQILALYDRENRIELEETSERREATAEVVRHLSRISDHAWVTYAWLTPENIERVIEEQIAYFESLGRAFEWKVYSHDWPPDMKDRLAARGFAIGEVEAFCVLDVEQAPPALLRPPAHEVRALGLAELDDLVFVHEKVWEEDYSWLKEEIASDMRGAPGQLLAYAAYVDGQPVSSARIRFHAGSSFADLYGGSTLPAYRGRGIYRDLVAVRVQEARKRGVRFLAVDASPMSRPILEKLGFRVLALTYPCQWPPKAGENHL
jgi:GNAT superfamily N-acetyltransferase